jgi:Mn2+/Fe2+ NRAMP family transporter
MAMMMLISSNRTIMGKFPVGSAMRIVGWTTTGVMGLAVLCMAMTAIG